MAKLCGSNHIYKKQTMGNSSGKDNNGTTGGGGGSNNKPSDPPVLNYNVNAPNNTNLFIIYNGITTEYLIKIIKSLQSLPITSVYTIFFPGFKIAPTLNKLKFTTYICDTNFAAATTTPTSNNNSSTTETDKNDATIDKIDTANFKATITQAKESCTIFTMLPNFSIDKTSKKITCTRNIADSNTPPINIYLVQPPAKSTDIIDCYIKDWSSFELDSKEKDAIGMFNNERLFKEDPELLSMYSFFLEGYNVNKKYKDNRFYFLLPEHTNVETMLRHIYTVHSLSNACTIYKPPYYSGQLQNVISAFLKYFQQTTQNFSYSEFSGKNPTSQASEKIICLNSSSRNNTVITFKNNTLDLYGNQSTKYMFYISSNKLITPTSNLYGVMWDVQYAYKDVPTEIYVTPDDLRVMSSNLFIYYHLECSTNDYYMVPQIINSSKKKLESDSSYTGFEEKFTLAFEHKTYDNDTIFQTTVNNIPFLKIVELNKTNKYILTNITTDKLTSILSNYYFSVAIAENDANKYTSSIAIDTNGNISTFCVEEQSKSNLIDKNPITDKQGFYYSRQIVQIPEEIKTNTLNTYILIAKDPNEKTLWNFCRQCFFNKWRNFVIITNFKVNNNQSIINDYLYLNVNDFYCIYPSQGNTFKKITTDTDCFQLELNNYQFYLDCESFTNNNINKYQEEHLGISFKSTTNPWMTIKDIPIGYQHRENSYNLHMDIPMFVGLPTGTITCVVNLKYIDKIDIHDRKDLLNTRLIYVILPRIPKDLVKPFIEFAEKDFEINSKTSKFNLIMYPEDSSIDVSSLVKIGKIHPKTKMINYLYDQTTMTDDSILTLKTNEYSNFQYIPDVKDFKSIDELLKITTAENPLVVNKINSPVSTLYNVLRKDFELSNTTILTLQLQNQLQFTCYKFDDQTLINSLSKPNQVPSFSITTNGFLQITVIRQDFMCISQFLQLLIYSKDLEQKKNEFFIVISIVDDWYNEYYNLLDILKKSVPCDVFPMRVQKVFVLTNTPLNFTDNTINSKSEEFTFVEYSDDVKPNKNYIVARSEIIGRSTQFKKIQAKLQVNGITKNFEQMVLTVVTDDFKIVPNYITPDFPLVNFIFVPMMEYSEINYIVEAFKTSQMEQNLIIVTINNIDYNQIDGTSVRKHLCVITPPHFPIAKIRWDSNYYYEVTIDDNKSNNDRQIKFIYVQPDSKLKETPLRALINERSFVMHYMINKNIGVSYSNELDVLCNDTSDTTFNLYNFNNLSKANAPKLYQWVTSANKSITYIRPIDRRILDGGSFTSPTYVIFAVSVQGSLHEFELINLIIHLYQSASKCCAAIIFNNCKPPSDLSKINYKIKNYDLNSDCFTKYVFNYIYHPTNKFLPISADPESIKIIENYIYYDNVKKSKTNYIMSVSSSNKYKLDFGNINTDITPVLGNRYSKCTYDLTILTTDLPVS